jgi:spermidine/putrescine transport system permease protein
MKPSQKLIGRSATIAVVGVFVAFAMGPLVHIVLRSFLPTAQTPPGVTGTLTLNWYAQAINDQELKMAVQYSIMIGLVVGCLSAPLGFVGALTWWSPRQRNILLAAEVICALAPGEAHALGLADVLAVAGLPTSGFFPIVIAHLIWTLPFTTAINMIGMSYISRNLIDAALEFSARFKVILRIVVPLVLPSLVSAFLVALLLSFNESSRGYFLAASQQTIGQFVRGKMRSGMDPSAQAIASIDVMLGALTLLAVAGGFYRTQVLNSRKAAEAPDRVAGESLVGT